MSIDPEELQDDPKGLREAVERANREAADAKAELDSLKRREAFRSAGLDFTNPQHAAIAKGYDGEVDGISAFVSDLGLDKAPQQAGIPADEQRSMERMSSIGSGDGAGVPEDATAEGNRRLKVIRDQAIREGWPKQKFWDDFTDEMRAQGRATAQLEIQGPH